MKEVSPNWEARKSRKGFLEKGFPFNEGLPINPNGKRFTLVMRTGLHLTDARVNPSTRDRNEGYDWLTPDNVRINSSIVIAWCEE